MAWVTNVVIDSDKANVGSVVAVFSDGDSSTFTATARGTLTQANATSFVSQADAARNAWQTRKAAEATDRGVLNSTFVTAGESASSTAINNASVAINLPG